MRAPFSLLHFSQALFIYIRDSRARTLSREARFNWLFRPTIPARQSGMTKVRDGLLLGKKTILKSDYLPACQNKSVNPRIEITIRFAPFSILVIDIFRYCREFRLSSLLLLIHLVVLAFFSMFTASLCQPPLGYETFLTTSELTKPAIKFKFFGLVLGRNRLLRVSINIDCIVVPCFSIFTYVNLPFMAGNIHKWETICSTWFGQSFHQHGSTCYFCMLISLLYIGWTFQFMFIYVSDQGMKRLNVDQMEEDLRGDVLMEASRFIS